MLHPRHVIRDKRRRFVSISYGENEYGDYYSVLVRALTMRELFRDVDTSQAAYYRYYRRAVPIGSDVGANLRFSVKRRRLGKRTTDTVNR